MTEMRRKRRLTEIGLKSQLLHLVLSYWQWERSTDRVKYFSQRVGVWTATSVREMSRFRIGKETSLWFWIGRTGWDPVRPVTRWSRVHWQIRIVRGTIWELGITDDWRRRRRRRRWLIVNTSLAGMKGALQVKFGICFCPVSTLRHDSWIS